MDQRIFHPWNLNQAEAASLQSHLAPLVIKKDSFRDINYVCSVDAAYDKSGTMMAAAAVTMKADSLDVIEMATAQAGIQIPYTPGLFAFRELPALVRVLEKLVMDPDLVICDGQGQAHPRRFGLASHLGVLFDIPAIGCGKTAFIGKGPQPGISRGSSTPLRDKGEIVGAILRTQDNIRPVFVSIGHRLSLPTACHWILQLCPDFRLPEPSRRAHQLAKAALAH